jgi:hypothetical protein
MENGRGLDAKSVLKRIMNHFLKEKDVKKGLWVMNQVYEFTV